VELVDEVDSLLAVVEAVVRLTLDSFRVLAGKAATEKSLL
jgi:hypothetical protein